MDRQDKIRVLVVEDSSSDLFLIQQSFMEVKEFDYEIITADRLSEGLELVQEDGFDVALLDLGLPDSQGLDTLRRFNSKNDKLPVLILTGLDDIALSISALQEGAQDYLVKDRINTKQLSQAVRHALERNKLNRKLKDSYERMRLLAHRQQHILEAERIRISRKVHDGLGQLLTALKMDLKWVKGNALSPSTPPEEFSERIVEAEDLVDRAIRSVQKIAIDLRPGTLDQLGIAEAIRDEAKRFQARMDIAVLLDMPDNVAVGNPEVSTSLFRIFQELLTNIARHAQADKVNIKLQRKNDWLVLDVIDNGIGITDGNIHAKTSLGLLGIMERAEEHNGRVSIFNSDAGGAHFSISIPVNGNKDA